KNKKKLILKYTVTKILFIKFLFSIFLLLLFGYTISFDVRHIKIAFYDSDKSKESREFTERLSSSSNFDITDYVTNEADINKFLDEKKAQCIIVFPYDFSKKLYSGESVKLQFLIDGVDGNTAS